jgi:sec-independent protein translocase protein TatA
VIGDILQPTHLLFVLVVALLVLGPKRLPELARTLGSGLRDFRAAINGEHDDRDDAAKPNRQIVSEDEPAFEEPGGHTALADDPTPPEVKPSQAQLTPDPEPEADATAHQLQAEPERQS